MEIITQKISTVDTRFIQDIDNQIDEITPLVSSLKKIRKHINSVGFSNGYTKEEKALWNEFADTVLGRFEQT